MQTLQGKIHASLANLFIGDALSMPVHWYYNPGDIIKSFPPYGIRKMEAAPAFHPSSIMSLHSTEKGGRGSQQIKTGQAAAGIVGGVILKGKRHLWGQANTHYHHGMQAGENTLNACCAKLLLDHLTDYPQYDLEAWVTAYIEFMTADPAQHNDTYAESYHRGFFANLAMGKHPLNCGAKTHDTPSMGALVGVGPLAMSLFSSKPLETVQRVCRQHVALTHPDDLLMTVLDEYVSLLHDCLFKGDELDVQQRLCDAAAVIPGARLHALLRQKKGDSAIVGRQFSLACYISDSWPSVCYLAAKYYKDPGKALLNNTNLGGENAHRGSVLGTLVGAISGNIPLDLYQQLFNAQAIEQSINNFLEHFYP